MYIQWSYQQQSLNKEDDEWWIAFYIIKWTVF